jgi:hypothetical protein
VQPGFVPAPSKPAVLLACPLALTLLACGPNLASQVAKTPELDRPGEAKCGVTKSQSEPLVVEWPSAARAKLEALSRTGVVAVRYSGCEMEVLASCNAPGKYAYTAINPKRDHVVIRNEDDLYANIPLGAARLESKLARTGELDVDMSIVGRYASDRATVRADELQGPDCSKATHVVSALTVGAFDFSAGAGANISGEAKLGNAGGGGSSQSSKELLNSDGHMSACDAARTSDGKPPEACGAILRLEVVPLGQAKQEVPAGAPQAALQVPVGAAAVAAGGSVEIVIDDKDQTVSASVEAGGKTVSCTEPVTYYKPCHLSGLAEGKGHLKITGATSFERDFPVSADGSTTLKLWHRGGAEEILGGVMTALGGGATVFSLLNGPGLSTSGAGGGSGLNIILFTTGIVVGGVGLPYLLLGLAASHDGLVIQAPGKMPEEARVPPLQWGGPLAPTTLRF